MITIIIQALWALGKTAVKDLFLALLGDVVLFLYLVGINVIALLFGAGLVVLLIRNLDHL